MAKHNGNFEITDILHCVSDKNTRSHPLLGIMSQNKLLTNADSYVRGCNNNREHTGLCLPFKCYKSARLMEEQSGYVYTFKTSQMFLKAALLIKKKRRG